MTFSPNGKWVAVTASNPLEGVVVLDGATGNQLAVLAVPSSARRDIPLDLMFSPDSETLTHPSVGGFNDGEPKTTFRTWKTSDWSSLGEQELPGRWFLRASRDELWANNVVNVSDSPYRDAFKVTIAPLRDLEQLQTLGPVEEPHPIHILPAGNEISLHDQVFDLRTGDVRTLPVAIEAVTADGRFAIGFEERQPPGGFVHALPLARQLWPQGIEQRFVVYELSAGGRVTTSQWMPSFADRLTLARSKMIGVTRGHSHWVLLWKVPID
jgi:hypothetical protein